MLNVRLEINLILILLPWFILYDLLLMLIRNVLHFNVILSKTEKVYRGKKWKRSDFNFEPSLIKSLEEMQKSISPMPASNVLCLQNFGTLSFLVLSANQSKRWLSSNDTTLKTTGNSATIFPKNLRQFNDNEENGSPYRYYRLHAQISREYKETVSKWNHFFIPCVFLLLFSFKNLNTLFLSRSHSYTRLYIIFNKKINRDIKKQWTLT